MQLPQAECADQGGVPWQQQRSLQHLAMLAPLQSPLTPNWASTGMPDPCIICKCFKLYWLRAVIASHLIGQHEHMIRS